MSCCACCCFYPKYKRKVDSIYPRNLEAPLIKIEVEKLQYYVKQHPEKLSKIGEYLYQNLKWGLNKNRNYVKNTIEAVDKILLVITPQNLNYYATNYLKIIQKLLEPGGMGMSSASISDAMTNNLASNLGNSNSDFLEYQKLAANLFRKFCEKEASNQSTANYNINYDTFVCQFSSMCYNNNRDEGARAEIRSSGLQCLATMVKRLVPDESLRAGFLWDNMDKIVPALLFIMHESYLQGSNSAPNEYDENLHDDDIELDHTLDRYLYGDFFIHSRTNNCLNKPDGENENQASGDLDAVKIELNNKSNSAQDGERIMMSNLNGGNMSASNSDEVGAMSLLNRKNSVEVVDPDHEAKMLLKNLASKADYTTISKIVLPILAYLDANQPSGWEYCRFVRCVFLILMYNVKQQHAIVIKELIKHLDSHINSSAKLKCHIIRAISTCIRIAAMHSVGTTGQINEIFTYLLKHLKSSVEKTSTLRTQLITKKMPASTSTGSFQQVSANTATNDEKSKNDIVEEQNLQRRIIDAMGQFTANLPDYSKNDVVMLIAQQINSKQFNYIDVAQGNQPVPASQQIAKDQQQNHLRVKYFECLHEICTKFRPTQLFSAFTSVPFLENILHLTLVADWASRRRAHEILHHLLDKYQILTRIKTLKPDIFNELLHSSSGVVTIKNNNKSMSSINRLNEKSASNISLKKVNKETDSNVSVSSSNPMTRNQTYLSQLDLSETKSCKEDLHFMRKYGRILLAHLNENLFISNNRRENYESIYLTTCLFLIGLYNENEFLVDLIRFGFHVQELALLNFDQNTSFSFTSNCSVHKFVCAFFLLLSKSSGISELYEYCSGVCDLRRKKNLYHFVYPEYVLLNSSVNADMGSQSRISHSEIENDFKKDLKSSANEYSLIVKKFEKNKSAKESAGDDQDNLEKSQEDIAKSTTSLEASVKMAPWLFNKKTIGSILEKAGFQTTVLSTPNSEYSLSINYLQQTVTSLQTGLKFRSPYSHSVESFSSLPTEMSVNFNSANGFQNGLTTSGSIINNGENSHRRVVSTGGPSLNMGLGPSSSTHQLGSTPRRSIDVESNQDGDDTSYDSASQYSLDPNNLPADDKLFYIDPSSETNQLTITSLNHLKQYQDLSSFETIRRVLGNSNAPSAGASLVNGNTTSVSSHNRSASQVQQHQRNASGIQDINENYDTYSNKSDSSTRIISDFRQKTFDQLLKSNQVYSNNEKYQKVFEFITKELTTSGVSAGTNQSTISNHNSINTSQTNTIVTTTQPQSVSNNLDNMNSGSINNINKIDENINNSSLSAGSLSSNPSISTNQIQQKEASYQKMVPLKDIEFPNLFMY